MRELIKKFYILIVIVIIFTLAFNIKIKTIIIDGNDKTNDTDIISMIFEKSIDKRSLVLYLKEKYKKHKKIPLISSYDIEWINPETIVIHVNENTTVGYFRRDLNNLYFDSDGNINEISEKKQTDVMEVVGIDFKNNGVGEKIDFTDKRLLNAILNISNFVKENSLPANLLEIRPGSEIFLYIGNISVKMGSIANMEIKLKRLVDIYPEIKTLKGTLDLSEAKENMIDEQYIFKKHS